MTNDSLSLGKQAQEYLAKFSSERGQGRSGKLHWDSFLVYAYKTHTNPPAVDLYSWLQDHLHDPLDADIEALIQDYQRVGALLTLWEHVADSDRFTELDDERQKLLQFVAKETCPGGLPLGHYVPSESSPENGSVFCSLPANMRSKNPHVLLIGRRDTGKTDLISRMVIHDIRCNDRAVVAIDADGELVDLVQRWVISQPDADELSRRILLIDPAAGAESLSFNALELPENGDLQGAASAVVFAFKAIYKEPPEAQSQWNLQTANILRNAAMLLIANGKTLADLPILLADNDYRDVLLEQIERKKTERPEYTTLLESWAQYKRLARTDQWINWVEPILVRVAPALSDPRLRCLLMPSEKNVSLKDCILGKKVLLLRIPQRHFNQNASLLGSLLITGVKQATSSLWQTAQERSVALYVDGLDNLLDNETIRSITDNTSKFEIGLIGSTRHLATFERNQTATSNVLATADSWSSMLTCFGSVAVFTVDKEDAQLLAAKLFPLDSDSITHSHRCAFDQEKLKVEVLVRQEPGNYLWWLVDKVGAVLPLRLPEQRVPTS